MGLSMKKKSKVKDKIDEEFQRKDFLNKNNIYEARTIFKQRNQMMDFKMNFMNDPKYSRELWQCSGCCRAMETMSHILYCPSYMALREGKDLNNLDNVLEYYIKVSKIRTNLKHGKNQF